MIATTQKILNWSKKKILTEINAKKKKKNPVILWKGWFENFEYIILYRKWNICIATYRNCDVEI